MATENDALVTEISELLKSTEPGVMDKVQELIDRKDVLMKKMYTYEKMGTEVAGAPTSLIAAAEQFPAVLSNGKFRDQNGNSYDDFMDAVEQQVANFEMDPKADAESPEYQAELDDKTHEAARAWQGPHDGYPQFLPSSRQWRDHNGNSYATYQEAEEGVLADLSGEAGGESAQADAGEAAPEEVEASFHREATLPKSYWAVTVNGKVALRISLGAISGGHLGKIVKIEGKDYRLDSYLTTKYGDDIVDNIRAKGSKVVLEALNKAEQEFQNRMDSLEKKKPEQPESSLSPEHETFNPPVEAPGSFRAQGESQFEVVMSVMGHKVDQFTALAQELGLTVEQRTTEGSETSHGAGQDDYAFRGPKEAVESFVSSITTNPADYPVTEVAANLKAKSYMTDAGDFVCESCKNNAGSMEFDKFGTLTEAQVEPISGKDSCIDCGTDMTTVKGVYTDLGVGEHADEPVEGEDLSQVDDSGLPPEQKARKGVHANVDFRQTSVFGPHEKDQEMEQLKNWLADKDIQFTVDEQGNMVVLTTHFLPDTEESAENVERGEMGQPAVDADEQEFLSMAKELGLQPKTEEVAATIVMPVGLGFKAEPTAPTMSDSATDAQMAELYEQNDNFRPVDPKKSGAAQKIDGDGDGDGEGGSDWGELSQGDRITDITDLVVGQIYLEYSSQFNSKNVVKIIKGDETGLDRPIVYGKFVEPSDHTQTRAGASSEGFAIWDHDLETDEYYAVQAAEFLDEKIKGMAEGYMVYTDERFPEVQIRHHGGSTFNIYYINEETGEAVEYDVFTHYPKDQSQGYKVPADEAKVAAEDHFDYMAEQQKEEEGEEGVEAKFKPVKAGREGHSVKDLKAMEDYDEGGAEAEMLDPDMEIDLDDDPDEYDAQDEPQEEDITLSPSGSLGGMTSVGQVGGNFLGEFEGDEAALEYVRNWMEMNNFYPTVWMISDHGNAVAIDPNTGDQLAASALVNPGRIQAIRADSHVLATVLAAGLRASDPDMEPSGGSSFLAQNSSGTYTKVLVTPTVHGMALTAGNQQFVSVRRDGMDSWLKAVLGLEAKKPENVSEDTMMDLKEQYPGEPDKAYGTAWKISKQKGVKGRKLKVPVYAGTACPNCGTALEDKGESTYDRDMSEGEVAGEKFQHLVCPGCTQDFRKPLNGSLVKIESPSA